MERISEKWRGNYHSLRACPWLRKRAKVARLSKGGFIYPPVKLLFPFFKMRYLRLGKVEQTAKIIQQGK